MNNEEIIINNEVSLFAQASKFCHRRLIISIRRFRRATAAVRNKPFNQI
jgi:hypothetical protein